MTELVVDPLADHDPEPRRRPPTPPESDVPLLAQVLGSVGRALILAGVVVFLFVGYQLWGTNLQEARAQDGLRDELTDRLETISAEFDPTVFASPVAADDALDPPPTTDATAGGDTDTDDEPAEALPAPTTTTTTAPPEVDELLALLFPEDGDALAQIRIPSIEVDKVVVRGVAVADLRKGPGHYSQTALPGNPGNASIAGHRTTYGAPFNRIDELMPGDEITVASIQGEFTYRVLDPTEAYADDLGQVDAVGEGHIIVRPSAVWVLGDFGDDRLTLTACHPKLSSRQRIIVAAELVDDAVELPDWAVEAEAVRQAETTEPPTDDAPEPSIADDPVLTDDEAPADAEIDDGEIAAGPSAPEPPAPDLDEGLNGERDALPPAAAWMLAAVAFWYGGGRLGRRFASAWTGRLALRLGGLVPAMVCLWFSFELLDRALPAG